jgi:CubicO group peptidase (beta-lactamase class C family)
MAWGDARQRYDLKSTTKSFGSIALGWRSRTARLRWRTAPGSIIRRWACRLKRTRRRAGWTRSRSCTWLPKPPGSRSRAATRRCCSDRARKWDYSDSGPNWLAECITLAYGRDLDEWMFERVFTPLGIQRDDLTWRRNSYRPATIEGVARREFGAGISRQRRCDGRIGYLMLRDGQWNGREILTKEYVQTGPAHAAGHEIAARLHPETYGNAARTTACCGGTTPMQTLATCRWTPIGRGDCTTV